MPKPYSDHLDASQLLILAHTRMTRLDLAIAHAYLLIIAEACEKQGFTNLNIPSIELIIEVVKRDGKYSFGNRTFSRDDLPGLGHVQMFSRIFGGLDQQYRLGPVRGACQTG